MIEEKIPEIPTTEAETELEEEIIYEEASSWAEVIHCVFAAFSSIEDVDMEMASPMDRRRIKRIRKKGLRLIDAGISELYAEKFEEIDNENNENNEED